MRLKSAVAAGMLVLTASSFAQSQTMYYNSLYAHPVSLIVSTAVEGFPLILTATYERALKSKVALVFTPGFMTLNFESGGDKLSATGFDLGVGIRRYLARPTSGIFLQAKGVVGYSSVSIESTISEDVSGSGVGAKILGYVGYKGQWDRIAMFIDIGLGYQYVGAEAESNNSDLSASYSGSGLGLGADFGIGYTF